MSRQVRHLSLLALLMPFVGCASTRQAAPPRPGPPPPMIGQRTAPARPDIVIRATAPMPQEAPARPAPPPIEPPVKPAVVKPPATDQPVKPAALDRPLPDAPLPDQAAKLRELHTNAANRYASINDYICRFRRREVVNGKPEPEDLLEFKFRKQPFSIYFKWVGGTLVGRELVYVKGLYENKLQIRTGQGDLIAGFRTSLDPHSARALANSRRSVDEAGIGNLIESFGLVLEEQQRGTSKYGTLRCLGLQPRPESAVPMDCVEQQVPSGLEKHLPRGGVRYFFFNRDERTRDFELPVLIITRDENQHEVEYYCYDRVNTNVGLRSDEFDPDTLWRKR
jgi:hypothetical protein